MRVITRTGFKDQGREKVWCLCDMYMMGWRNEGRDKGKANRRWRKNVKGNSEVEWIFHEYLEVNCVSYCKSYILLFEHSNEMLRVQKRGRATQSHQSKWVTHRPSWVNWKGIWGSWTHNISPIVDIFAWQFSAQSPFYYRRNGEDRWMVRSKK